MARRRHTLSFSLFAFQDIITAVTGILLLITITLAIILITTKKAIPVEDRTKYHQDLQKEVEALAKQRDSIQQDLEVVANKNAGLSRLNGKELKREVEYAVQALKVANSKVDQLKKKQTVLGKAWSEQESRDDAMSTALRARNSKDQQELNDIRQKISDMRTRDRFYFNLPDDINKRAWLLQISKTEVAVAPVDGKSGTKRYGSPAEFFKTLKQYPSRSNYFVLFAKPSGVLNFEQIQAKLDLQSYDFGIDAIDEDASIVPKGG